MILQENIDSSSLLFLAPAFSSTSFTLKYQARGASRKLYTVTNNFHNLIVSVSGEDFKKLLLLTSCSCRKAELISNEWLFHSKETIIEKIILKFSLQHFDESYYPFQYSQNRVQQVVTTHLTHIAKCFMSFPVFYFLQFSVQDGNISWITRIIY